MATLGYWKIRGLGQPIRLLLNYVGDKFENVMYEQGDGPEFSREAWLKVKPTLGLDFPNLPYYIDGNIRITQSNAILRYIARKHNLLGQTEKERINVDMMMEQAMDLRNAFVQLCYSPDYLTVADFHMYEMMDQHRIMVPGILDDFPKLKAFLNAFEALPPIKTYLASDNFLQRPINNKIASFK